jgi:hypothetical protein
MSRYFVAPSGEAGGAFGPAFASIVNLAESNDFGTPEI